MALSTTPKPSPAHVAKMVVDKAKEYGFNVTVSGSVMTVYKRFSPGDKQAFTIAESEAGSLLSMVKMVEPGSTWGTDGGSVGGHVGLTGGYMQMHKSGCSKRILSAISKYR